MHSSRCLELAHRPVGDGRIRENGVILIMEHVVVHHGTDLRGRGSDVR